MQKDNEYSWSGMGTHPGLGPSNYLIVRAHKGGFLDLLRYIIKGDDTSKGKFTEWKVVDPRIKILKYIATVVLTILQLLRVPMERTGCIVDKTLNFLSLNGGLFGLLSRCIRFKGFEKPEKDTVTFLSTIGQLDERIELYKGWNFVKQMEFADSVGLEPGNRGIMDLCVMASKLAYENNEVVANVVHDHWKMNLVGVLDCWNDYQRRMSKTVFILTDKPKDANLILISFRGTEPFDAEDWAIDFDFSLYPAGNKGYLHTGFLEAMGLGNREKPSSFGYHLSVKTSSVEEDMPEMTKESAYYKVFNILQSLLSEHENAQVVITGHSLGGALAILFPTVLALKKEGDEIMKRLLGIYTFGQPRIGDRGIAEFMKGHLSYPVDRYFRVVYCNDIVPRLPYDDRLFIYHHFGSCHYYDSFYNEITEEDDEPDPNGFGMRYWMRGHITAVWELIRGLTMGITHGSDYKEGWFRILMRFMGIFLPGMSDHCTTDYLNSVRLGPVNNLKMTRLGRVLRW